ncbi:hypothetical protein [Staphylococcus lugdunensis]|uniref:hypothetical protein n=1 Tax=Staphylococcus lugdunensis TaxID=28035 RepID=UPI001CD95DAE|nr:hypothetical protein [Staphylococcus lugdunensis]
MKALDLIEELQDAMEHYGDFDVKTERNEDIELKHIYSFQPEATAVINVKGRMPMLT